MFCTQRYVGDCCDGSFVEMSRKEEDCVLLQCREQNQLCVARSDITCVFTTAVCILMYVHVHVQLQC